MRNDVGDIAVFLLVVFAEQAAIESALFSNLCLDDRLAEHASDVGAARGVLRAWKITDLHDFSSTPQMLRLIDDSPFTSRQREQGNPLLPFATRRQAPGACVVLEMIELARSAH
jgi:hypothetical protein